MNKIKRGLKLMAENAARELDTLISPEKYWQRRYEQDLMRPKLRARKKACRDCAVVYGLYTEISESLSKQPEHIKRVCSQTWFCHETPNRACKGNIDMAYRRAENQNFVEEAEANEGGK